MSVTVNVSSSNNSFMDEDNVVCYESSRIYHIKGDNGNCQCGLIMKTNLLTKLIVTVIVGSS